MSDESGKHLNMSQEKRLNVAQEKILREPADVADTPRITTKELDRIKSAAGSGAEILRMVAEVRRLRALVSRLHGYMGAPIDPETRRELEREILAQREEERGGDSIP